MALAGTAPAGTTDAPEVPRLFGTDGVRMVVGDDLTPQFAVDFASAVGGYVTSSAPVLIGRDFRRSSEAFARILAGGLMLHGLRVRDMGVMPTPCLQYNVRALGAALG